MPRLLTLNKIRARISTSIFASHRTLTKILHPRLKQAFYCRSHLTPQEIVALSNISRGKRNIAEIGSYVGASACAFGAAATSNSKSTKIFCIDTWNNDAMSEGCVNTFDEFAKNTINYSMYIVPMRGWSYDIAGELNKHTESLDLLFIDGDHSYEGCKKDWDLYKKFLRHGSVVVFHDTGWAEGVRRVVAEDVRAFMSEEASLPNMWWGTLKCQPN